MVSFANDDLRRCSRRRERPEARRDRRAVHVLEVEAPVDDAGVEWEPLAILGYERAPEVEDPVVGVDDLGLGVGAVEIRVALDEVDPTLVAVDAPDERAHRFGLRKMTGDPVGGVDGSHRGLQHPFDLEVAGEPPLGDSNFALTRTARQGMLPEILTHMLV